MAIFIQRKYQKDPRYKRVLVREKYYKMVQEKGKLTRARRDPYSGRLMGRYTGVPSFASDSGRYLVLVKDFDLNKDNKPELYKGQIIARLKKGIRQKPASIIIKVSAEKFRRRR